MTNRYIKTESNGIITFSPVDAADVNADGVLDSKDTLAVVAAIPKPPPVQPPPVDPPPIISGVTTVTAKPGDDLSSIAADIVVLRGGTYLPAPSIVGLNYAAPLQILKGGSSLNPRTYKAYPGEVPIISGKGCTYAIRVGDVRNDVGAGFVVIDGIEACDADWNGVILYRCDSVTLRNILSHGNSVNAYKGGIQLTGGNNCVVENSRIWDNGYGVSGEELDEGSTNPVGPVGAIVRNCFVSGNTRSSVPGNSAGIGFRFGSKCLVENNVLYDGCDANVNGLGNTFCTFRNNACYNAWFTWYWDDNRKEWYSNGGANQEAMKMSVRGGGYNVIVGNINVYNGVTGFDACQGAFDVVANNTFYANGSKGILAEGLMTYLFNNAAELNDITGAMGTNAADHYKDLDGFNVAPGSDYNLFASSSEAELKNWGLSMPNSLLGVSAGFANPTIVPRREDIRQQFKPSDLWTGMTGDIKTDVANVYGQFKARYTAPSLVGKGTTAGAIKAKWLADKQLRIDEIKKRMDEYTADPGFNNSQAISRYQMLLDAEAAGFLPDLAGVVANIGAQ